MVTELNLMIQSKMQMDINVFVVGIVIRFSTFRRLGLSGGGGDSRYSRKSSVKKKKRAVDGGGGKEKSS
jgi:hypothetical protein